MKVLALYEHQAVLDLVAHFLGIAMHDNDNSPPAAAMAVRDIISDSEDD